MIFKFDPGSSVPIFEQLVESVRRAILSGELAPDERLPSVRDVAVECRLNPKTVSRAYYEMERDGILYTRRGEGTFVARIGEGARDAARIEALGQAAAAFARCARALGATEGEAAEALGAAWAKEEAGGAAPLTPPEGHGPSEPPVSPSASPSGRR